MAKKITESKPFMALSLGLSMGKELAGGLSATWRTAPSNEAFPPSLLF